MNCLTIALSGLDEADVQCVRATLSRESLSRWQLHEEASGGHADADLLIVDVDSVWGHMDWLKSTARGQRTVSHSNQPASHADDLRLAKPMDSDQLTRLLHALSEHATGNACEQRAPQRSPEIAGERSSTASSVAADHSPQVVAAVETQDSQTETEASPAVDAPADAADSFATHDTNGSAEASSPEASAPPETVGEWLLAATSDAPFALRGETDEALLVDPKNGVYHGNTQLKPLIGLLKLPPDAARAPDMQELAQLGRAQQPIERLLWLAALVATPGRLSTHHDSDSCFRLNRWPQIEREFPRHFRIATAMMKQPGSLGELASTANTPQADVADFINAYTVTGHVIASDEDAAATQSERPRLRKLFARSANR